jgi:hypothetical protein
MNTEKDLLKNLFHEMKMENSSGDFMKNLMVRIEREAIKQQRKKQIYNFLYIAAGVACMFCIPALVLFFFGINISFENNFSGIFNGIRIEQAYITFALIILLLLIGDTLLRKRFRVF